jgi:hypothetical protein
MESEIDFFCSSTTPKERMGASSFQTTFQPPSSSGTQFYDSEFLTSNCQDFLGWSMDGETTTEPASDDLDGCYQIGSSSSDEDSERQVPWALGSLSWKMTSHADSLANRGQPRNGKSLHNLVVQTPLPPCPQASCAPELKSNTREQLPEEGLIDIDPEEGRRRGSELMAMLTFGDGAKDLPEKAASACSTEPSRSNSSLVAPRLAHQSPSSACQPVRQYPHQQKRPSPQWSTPWESGWEVATPGPLSSSMESSRHMVAIQHAAHDAFGALLKEVKVDATGVYLVSLHPGMRQYDEVPVLSILSRSLWPLLGREVIALEPSVDLDGHQRLIMRMHDDETELDSKSCWEFATTGTCPRGSRCRWEHNTLTVRYSFIEVVY